MKLECCFSRLLVQLTKMENCEWRRGGRTGFHTSSVEIVGVCGAATCKWRCVISRLVPPWSVTVDYTLWLSMTGATTRAPVCLYIYVARLAVCVCVWSVDACIIFSYDLMTYVRLISVSVCYQFTLPRSPAPYWTYPPEKIFDTNCTTSYILNSGITEPNLTKYLQGAQKWLPITLLKSKLRSSNLFGNANMTNKDRRQIAGKSRQKLHVLTV